MPTENNVRVRFAPSPTGGLHIGGVRTVLYNYLFARQHKGTFILRIEDTDQTRFVEGAEAYIFDCLNWLGLQPDESVINPGNYGPYRQSERKALYKQYALNLVEKGYAYYAFDTPGELQQMREDYKTETQPNPQYDHQLRQQMRNSLTLSAEETEALINNNTPYVIRVKMPENKTISFTDMVRGEVSFDSNQVDDKVLLKADGMPTYHLAVVVDDYLMKITHAFRGEEWLPSAPVHVYVWQQLFGVEQMPHWAHFPLILGPSGKLSKRDGAKYGFPVFAMNWTDAAKGETVAGFKEQGFLPQALINLLALLGWNDGSEQEIFTLEELIEKFSIEKIHSSGARFDFEKAKWFNHEWIKRSSAEELLPAVKEIYAQNNLLITDDILLIRVIELVKERCTLLPDFFQQGAFFFAAPEKINTEAIQPKWNTEKTAFFSQLALEWASSAGSTPTSVLLESRFKELAAAHNIKPGELMLPLRIMLVGDKFGPGVFDIACIIGLQETAARINKTLTLLT